MRLAIVGLAILALFESRPWPSLYEEGTAALDRRETDAAITAIERASRLAPPNHPFVLYAQLRAYVQSRRFDDAFRTLSLLVEKGLAADLLVSPEFEALREHPRWSEWEPRVQALVAPTSRSVVAFRLDEPDLVPSAMTYDRGSRRFLVSSAHKRKILAIDEISGRAADYATFRQSGFLGVRGLQADNTRGALYVLSATGADVEGPVGSDEGETFVHRLQLSSGRSVSRVAPASGGSAHRLSHLVQGRDGTLYMTNTGAGLVQSWKPGTRAIETFVRLESHLAPTGLTWSADGRALYVSHLEGVSRIDMRTRAVDPVGHPASMTLVGIDGLATHQADLIAVQAGLPGVARVLRLRLTADGLNVASMDVLDANLPDHDGPVAGVVVGDGFYYIANGQASRVMAPDKAGAPTMLQKPVIRRVNLR